MKFYQAYTLDELLKMPYQQYVELVYEMYRRLIAEKKANDRAASQDSSKPGATLEELKSVQKG